MTTTAEGALRAAMVREKAALEFDQSVVVERRIGAARGVVAEIWRSGATGRIALTVAPTAAGYTVLAIGTGDDLDVFARVGETVLRALDGVLPIALGDVFRSGPSVVERHEAVKTGQTQ